MILKKKKFKIRKSRSGDSEEQFINSAWPKCGFYGNGGIGDSVSFTTGISRMWIITWVFIPLQFCLICDSAKCIVVSFLDLRF